MERLTEWTGYEWIPHQERLNGKVVGHRDCMNLLAAYENTGLTPEEIMDGKLLTGWIPVSKQLPKEPSEGLTDLEDLPEYLVTIAGAKESTTLQYMGDGEWYRDGVFYSTGVVAWVHMPAVYKEE